MHSAIAKGMHTGRLCCTVLHCVWQPWWQQSRAEQGCRISFICFVDHIKGVRNLTVNIPIRPHKECGMGPRAGFHSKMASGEVRMCPGTNASSVDWLALPDHLSGIILGSLPLPALILAHKVCKPWHEVVAHLPVGRRPAIPLWQFAGDAGDLALVRWLHEHLPEGCTTAAMDGAADNGHLAVVRWLHEHRTEGCTTYAMDGAAMNGHLEVVRWLHEHRKEGCTTAAMLCAAVNGHLGVVRWLSEHRAEGCSAHVMDAAAKKGRIDVVRWLHEHRPEGCTARAMDLAASNGHLEVLRWLHENRTEGCTKFAMDLAASSGHLEVLRWLHAHRTEGCTWFAVVLAAKNGHTDVVRWLREVGRALPVIGGPVAHPP